MAASKDKARAILSYATPNPVGPYKLTTPLIPNLGVGKTKTPILPVMGGTLVNVPTPVMPTRQTTPVAPPLPKRLVNVPTPPMADKLKTSKSPEYMEDLSQFTIAGASQREAVSILDALGGSINAPGRMRTQPQREQFAYDIAQSFKSLKPKEKETFLALLPEWVGAPKELAKAARSLSK